MSMWLPPQIKFVKTQPYFLVLQSYGASLPAVQLFEPFELTSQKGTEREIGLLVRGSDEVATCAVSGHTKPWQRNVAFRMMESPLVEWLVIQQELVQMFATFGFKWEERDDVPWLDKQCVEAQLLLDLHHQLSRGDVPQQSYHLVLYPRKPCYHCHSLIHKFRRHHKIGLSVWVCEEVGRPLSRYCSK
jgi:hypothetical protein